MHTVMRLILPSTTARTRWIFGRLIFLVLLWAWLTLLPTKLFLPQISHFRLIFAPLVMDLADPCAETRPV